MVKRERTSTRLSHDVNEYGREVVKLVKVTQVIKRTCPVCRCKRAWPPRGVVATVYLWKCTRCGYQEPIRKVKK